MQHQYRITQLKLFHSNDFQLPALQHEMVSLSVQATVQTVLVD
jgi:hypothetical protein